MGLTIPYLMPQWAGNPSFEAPVQQSYVPAPSAFWREGDVLISTPTGTIVNPPGLGVGTGVGVAGPLASAVTVTQTVTANAPGGSYYYVLTYTGTSTNESLPGTEFVVNSLPGYLPTISVAAAGAPAMATGFAVYASKLPGYEVRQSTGTTLGSTVTVANPFANSIGVQRAATNPSTNIVGIAVNDSNANFFSGIGGSINVGNQSLYGATVTVPPLTPNEAYTAYVVKLQGFTYWEFSLRQTYTWTPALIGTTCGLTLDTVSGFWVVDPSANGAICTIINSSDGVQSVVGSIGDLGKRVIVSFNGTGLV
jgi:hypothetical protein